MGVLERAPRNATVVAKTPMTLLTLSSWDVKRLESKSPEAMEQLQQVIQQRRASSYRGGPRLRRNRAEGGGDPPAGGLPHRAAGPLPRADSADRPRAERV